ncbi:EamA family transporter [Formicincola oecophyllae]|uniref:EamA family transporter n=1 Tax=Formicincola oecophyllae TaxID=2558361 RepID=A0A4Y6UB97_9PROT|nr:EamA family transporter [Formicincola oecophyllae]QDH13671.1 EamA family transporter [Formicincola oecophyllae]
MSVNGVHVARRELVIGLSILLVLAWGSTFPVINMALGNGFTPVPLAAARYGLAGLIILPALLRAPRMSPSAWGGFALCGLTGIAAFNVFLNWGEMTVSGSAASLINASTPIMAALMGVFLGREKLTASGWLGSIVALCGVAVVCQASESVTLGWGALLVVGSAFSNAVFNVLQKPLAHRYGALLTMGWVIMAGAFFLLPWLPEALGELRAAPWAGRAEVLWLALVPGLVGFACWAWLLKHVRLSQALLLLYAVPPAAIVEGVVLQGQWPGLETLVGGCIVLGGLALSRLDRPRPTPTLAPEP